MNLETYMHGDCHLFALALHQEFGYDMVYVFDEMDIEVQSEVLIHAYCKTKNGFVDARGFFNEEDALAEHDYSRPYTVDVSVREVHSLIETGFLHTPSFGQMDELTQYLKDNKEWFEETVYQKEEV